MMTAAIPVMLCVNGHHLRNLRGGMASVACAGRGANLPVALVRAIFFQAMAGASAVLGSGTGFYFFII